MKIDLHEPFISASERRLPEGRVRLTIDYPATPKMRAKIMNAIIEMIRPDPATGPEATPED